MQGFHEDPDRAAGLRAVGIDDDEERVYRWLLAAPAPEVADVGAGLGLPPDRAEALIDSLEAKGLLTRAGPHGLLLVAEPPDLAVERLILRRREELEQARLTAAGLAARFREPSPGAQPESPVEIAVGAAAVRRHLEELTGAATGELLVMSTGEEGWPLPGDGSALELREGAVRRRVIYDREALEEARITPALAAAGPDGLEARCAGDVPVTLMVADRRAAVVSLPAGAGSSVAGGVVVRPSALLDALVALFELLWSRAVPVARRPAGGEGGLSAEDSRLVSLLLAGLTDRGMARQLGCSVRTVQRRLGGLMSRRGVATRLQLVWQVAREGGLGDG
jgi:DNA-binding CsgD family transcriptional regulator